MNEFTQGIILGLIFGFLTTSWFYIIYKLTLKQFERREKKITDNVIQYLETKDDKKK